MSEVREERVPFEIAVAFLFGNDVPEWVGSAVSNEECPIQCSECLDRDFCWLVGRDNIGLEDLVPEW